MSASERLGKAGGNYARGVATKQLSRLDESTEAFKGETAAKLENLASQVRELGQKYERSGEANHLARRLEKTADYIRFRSSERVVSDAWEAARRHRLLWWTGGLLAGVIVYRLVSQKVRQDRGVLEQEGEGWN